MKDSEYDKSNQNVRVDRIPSLMSCTTCVVVEKKWLQRVICVLPTQQGKGNRKWTFPNLCGFARAFINIQIKVIYLVIPNKDRQFRQWRTVPEWMVPFCFIHYVHVTKGFSTLTLFDLAREKVGNFYSVFPFVFYGIRFVQEESVSTNVSGGLTAYQFAARNTPIAKLRHWQMSFEDLSARLKGGSG